MNTAVKRDKIFSAELGILFGEPSARMRNAQQNTVQKKKPKSDDRCVTDVT